jgi:broad specificity phosphatase PhoE
MQKSLILIRHAHRDNSRREIDNGLDEKGREQAKCIRRFFTERFSKEDLAGGLWLLSSPKIRCVETLQPLAKILDRSVDIHPELDEQSGKESAKAFSDRVAGFLKEWKESRIPLTVACSHGDWLPLATQQLMGWPQMFKKGAWFEVEWDAGCGDLQWYIPTFKAFYK